MAEHSLKDPLIQACNDLFPQFGLTHKFMCELKESSLNSLEKYTILVGLTVGLSGNIVVSIPEKTALKIISAMMFGAEVKEIDEMGQSALCEFTNMLMGSTLTILSADINVDMAPPTLIVGEGKIVLSRHVESKKLFFKLDDSKFNIAYQTTTA